MAKTTENDGNTTRTGIADVRAAVESARAAQDESDDSDDEDSEDDSSDSDNDSEDGDDGAENSADDTEESDDADGDEDGADEEDEDNPDDKKSLSKVKYPQYAGDGKPATYISNLEKAHKESTTEAIGLRTELNTANGRVDAVMRAVASNPELSKALNEAVNKGSSGTGDGEGDGDGEKDGAAAVTNPFVKDLEAQWRDNSTKEIDTFIEANPEVASDPKIKADVQYWMGVFSNEHHKRTGRLLSGGEAMTQAYKHLGLENKLDKQTLAAGAKKTAAPTRPRGKAKKTTSQKPSFSADQIAMARAMGKDESWLSKNAKQ